MAEVSMGTLYDMNKNVIANLSALSKRQVKDRLLEISEYIKKTDNRYYMMLCHEARDYTVFNIQKNDDSIHNAIEELKLCLDNRGEIYSIAEDTNGAIEIWIKGTGYCEYLEKDKFYMYYLFPYDAAVIEV